MGLVESCCYPPGYYTTTTYGYGPSYHQPYPAYGGPAYGPAYGPAVGPSFGPGPGYGVPCGPGYGPSMVAPGPTYGCSETFLLGIE